MQPDLRFMPGGEDSGFTPGNVTSFQDVNPTAIVRELLQNSLDAVRCTGRKTAHVRFELTGEHSLENIPGIDSYRRALKQAVKSHRERHNGQLPDQAQSIVSVITGCLKDKKCKTLYVLDDGVGLNPKRMRALLGDGISDKDSKSTGAVGNGHLTALPASDLRYVLYGGLYEKAKMICAGHAILASHEDDDSKKCMGKDGYFVSKLRPDDFHNKYIFPKDDGIPEYIRGRLNWIYSNWETRTGTVVAIPAFNNFRNGKKKSLWQTVSQAAACNFFPAFADNELEIEVSENGKNNTLNHRNIMDILESVKDEQRTRTKFLSGSRAYSAFETIKTGDSISVDTGSGNVSMKVLQSEGVSHTGKGQTRIDLCRNNMWITSQLPGLDGNKHFNNLQTFHCVILLKAEDGDIHRLVRNAEGSLHNELKARKWLLLKDQKKLKAAIGKIYEKLQEVIPQYEAEKHRIHGFLNVDGHGSFTGGQRRRAGEVQQFSKILRHRSKTEAGLENAGGENEEVDDKNSGNGSDNTQAHKGDEEGNFHKRGAPLSFEATSSLIGTRSCIIEIIPLESAASAEVSFWVDENIDETCDDRSERQFVKMSKVRVDGWPVRDTHISRDRKDNPLGIRLGKLEQGKSLVLEFNFKLPKGNELSDNIPVVLKTQLIKSTWSTQKKQGDKR